MHENGGYQPNTHKLISLAAMLPIAMPALVKPVHAMTKGNINTVNIAPPTT